MRGSRKLRKHCLRTFHIYIYIYYVYIYTDRVWIWGLRLEGSWHFRFWFRVEGFCFETQRQWPCQLQTVLGIYRWNLTALSFPSYHIARMNESKLMQLNNFAATWTFARSWRPAFLILIPHEDKDDKVDVFTPFNILVIGGGEFWSLIKIKLMLFPQSAYCS